MKNKKNITVALLLGTILLCSLAGCRNQVKQENKGNKTIQEVNGKFVRRYLGQGDYRVVLQQKNENHSDVYVLYLGQGEFVNLGTLAFPGQVTITWDSNVFSVLDSSAHQVTSYELKDKTFLEKGTKTVDQREIQQLISDCSVQKQVQDFRDKESCWEQQFARDLYLRILKKESAKTSATEGIALCMQMVRISNEKVLDELNFTVAGEEWLSQLSDVILVDYQHMMVGVGMHQEDTAYYRLYHFDEVEGFTTSYEKQWDIEPNHSSESVGWVRANDVYILSPDGKECLMYDIAKGR